MAAMAVAHAWLSSSVLADWVRLPPLPDSFGFAGGFAGVSNGALVFAGGANFPNGPPWDGGTKVWHDRVLVLESPGSTWREAGNLPEPRGYGVSVTTDSGVLCIGGSDVSRHLSSCIELIWNGDVLDIRKHVDLPFPLAEMAGVRVGSIIHVIGGTRKPGATRAESVHLMLDLRNPESGWVQHPFPGPGRILPVAATVGASLLVVSGASLSSDANGRPIRTYLRDAWRYDSDKGWREVQSSPRPSVAAPNPAPAVGSSHFIVIGGDDGKNVGFEPPSAHPGFPRDILSYDVLTDTWAIRPEIPEGMPAPVTAPVVDWKGMKVIVSGEVRPATRTPEVLGFRAVPLKMGFGVLNWVIVGLYLGGMVGVGWWFMNREGAASTDAYFRGGQRIPWWVAGLSIFATMLSSLTFMGIPARSYLTDMSWYIGQLPILIVVPLVVFFYLPFFRKLNVTSAYEFLEQRFNYGCRLFAALSFILFHVGRVAIVLYLPALALAAVADIHVITAIIVMGVLCVVYTVMGGIAAVVWTDAIQSVVLMGGAVLCLVLAIQRVDGGLATVTAVAVQDSKLFQGLQWDSLNYHAGTASVWVLFLAFFFNTLVPYTSSQDVVQRYVTTRDIRAARRSLWTTMGLSIIGSMVFFLLGVAIYVFHKMNPQQMDPALVSTDSILPHFIVSQLPAGLSGLVIAAIFAASQSTISSSLNSMATSWNRDIHARLLRPDGTDAEHLRVARWTVIILGGFGIGAAIWMATSGIQSAFATFNSLIGLTAGSLGGLFALGVFTRRAHGRAAFAGAIIGFLLVLTCHLWKVPVSGLLYACVGCLTSFTSGWFLSLWLPRAMSEFSKQKTRLSSGDHSKT
jgi:solute:Na+ symporter, SSS family